MTRIIIISLIFIALISCKKEAGEGGASIINGKITINEYSEINNTLVRSYNAADEDVFIIYGDNDFYGDKISTDENGTYQFENLQKGDYKLYSFSDNEEGDTEAIYSDVNISSNGSVTNASTITIKSYTSKGKAQVSGRLFVYDYNAELTTLKDQYYGANIYVYFAIKNSKTYIDRVKTNPSGYFVFSDLLPGTYEVYAYSKANNAAGIIESKKDVIITKYDEIIVFEDNLDIID